MPRIDDSEREAGVENVRRKNDGVGVKMQHRKVIDVEKEPCKNIYTRCRRYVSLTRKSEAQVAADV